MAGVGITGKIKAKDGGAFPVFEDTDGQGGLRCVTTIAERNTFSAAPLFCKPGMQCYVEDLQCVYELAHDLATWTLFQPSPKLALQTDWYVSLAGNDNADGKTLGTAITQEELQRRLFPRCTAMLMLNDVTIHIGAGAYLSQFFAAGTGDGVTANGFTLTLAYEISSSAPQKLTNVIQTDGSTRTRGRLTVGAGAFVNQERIRLVTGAQAGAIAYSMGLVAANPLDTFVSLFTIPSFAGFHFPHPAAIGDDCVIDTLLTTVSRLVVNVDSPRVRVVVQDAKITRITIGGIATETPSADNGGNVLLAGCQAVSISGYWVCTAGGACVSGCRWVPTTKTSLKGEGWLLISNVVQGMMGVSGGGVHSYGLAIDGGALCIGCEFTSTYPYIDGSAATFGANRGYVGGGSIEVENGPGVLSPLTVAAVTVFPGSQMVVGDLVDCEQWGASTPYALGYNILPGGHVYQNQPAATTIRKNFDIPSTQNWIVGGEPFAYSDNEIFVPNQNCGVHAIGGLGGPRSYTDAQFYLTAQSGNQAAATFSASNFLAGAGMYRVSGYVSTTTADAAAAGAPTLNVLFTDDSGVARTVPVAVAPSVTTLGGAGDDVTIEVSAASAGTVNSIRWSVSGVVTPGAAQYSARLRVEKLTSGA